MIDERTLHNRGGWMLPIGRVRPESLTRREQVQHRSVADRVPGTEMPVVCD